MDCHCEERSDEESRRSGTSGIEILRSAQNDSSRAGIRPSRTILTTPSEIRGGLCVVSDGAVVPLGVPISVRLRTVELGGGWRIVPRQLPKYTFYGGAALLRVRYAEESDFARDEDVTQGYWGRAIFGGVELKAWHWLVAGGEVQYRTVPGALGEGGVSAIFNETNLGGFAIRGLIAIKK